METTRLPLSSIRGFHSNINIFKFPYQVQLKKTHNAIPNERKHFIHSEKILKSSKAIKIESLGLEWLVRVTKANQVFPAMFRTHTEI